MVKKTSTRTTKAKKTAASGIIISSKMQFLFLAVVAVSFMFNILTIGWLYGSHGSYVSAGTWAFQYSTWLLPIAFLGVAFLYTRRLYTQALHKLFVACLLTVAGLMAYGAVSMLANTIRSHYHVLLPSYRDSGILNAFGYDWAFMIAALAVFAGFLGWQEKGRRRKL